jgi:adenosylmethionine-8-amino-7-oxononanoate aminotransferase
MTRRCSQASVLVLTLAAGAALTPAPAFAIMQFAEQFKAVYVKEGTPLAAAVATAKCNVCHVGDSKKERNAYGQALAERLDKKQDMKNVEKIRQALAEVAALPSAVDGKTFGDLIAEGKLPAGE